MVARGSRQQFVVLAANSRPGLTAAVTKIDWEDVHSYKAGISAMLCVERQTAYGDIPTDAC